MKVVVDFKMRTSMRINWFKRIAPPSIGVPCSVDHRDVACLIKPVFSPSSPNCLAEFAFVYVSAGFSGG